MTASRTEPYQGDGEREYGEWQAGMKAERTILLLDYMAWTSARISGCLTSATEVLSLELVRAGQRELEADSTATREDT